MAVRKKSKPAATEFCVSEDTTPRAFRATMLDDIPQQYSLILRGEETLPPRCKFQWASGARKPGRVVFTDGMLILVDRKFRDAIRELTGWRSTPVGLLGEADKRIPGYHSLSVVGRCGKFLPKKSTLLRKSGRRFSNIYQGVAFAIADGEMPDFSVPDYGGTLILVSKKCAELLRGLDIKNLRIDPCADYMLSPDLYRGLKAKAA